MEKDYTPNLNRFFNKKDTFLKLNLTGNITLEVSWIMDSSKHFDDQIEIFKINDRFIGIIVADGVSNSSGGRIASTYLAEFIPENLATLIKGFIEKEEIVETEDLGFTALKYAINNLKKDISYENLKKDLFDSNSMELLKSIKMLDISSKISQTFDELRKSIKNAIISHQNFLNEFETQFSIVQNVIYCIKEYENLIKILKGYQSKLSQTIKELRQRIKDIKNSLNIIEKSINDKQNIIDEDFYRQIEEIINLLVLFMKIIDEEVEGDLEKDLNNPKIFDTIWERFQKQHHITIKNLLEFEKNIEGKLPNWINIILKYINRSNEDLKELFDDLLKRLKNLKTDPVESTLAFFLIQLPNSNELKNKTELSKLLKFWSFILGDPEVYIYCFDEQWLTYYEVPQGKLKNYTSSDNGIVGRLDICKRYLSTNDVLIIASDGANLKWTTTSGYPLIPFQKILTGLINSENTIKNVPNSWYKKIKDENALSDDFSLVIVRMTKPGD